MSTNQSTPLTSRLSGALSALREQHKAPVNRAFEHSPAHSLLLGGLSLTDEQLGVLKSGARKIKVQAFAGTGKTTLLRAFSEQAHQARGIYLAFNHSVAKQAQTLFPSNVSCQTHNAMALRALRRRDAAWGALAHGKLDHVTPAHLKTISGESGLNLEMVLATLLCFIQSADYELTEKHFPLKEALFLGHGNLQTDPKTCVAFARQCWVRMADPTSLIPMPHDGYLKLWSIAPAQLACDFILNDESQDSNPAFLSGMAQQKCRQIFVGDEHQGIYGFRGAVNALSTLSDCESHNLTLTHRFGSNLSEMSNEIVRHKGHNIFLRSSSDAANTQISLGRAPLGQNPLYLARTNAGLFEQALSLAQQGKHFHLIGGDSKFNFPDLHDLVALAAGDPAGRYHLYHDITELEEAAMSQGKNDLALRAKLARTHGGLLPAMLETINKKLSQALPAANGADMPKLSTVHQAKGLESGWVELLDDFAFAPHDAPNQEIPLTKDHIEECNVLYVALTRARSGLAIQSGPVTDWARPLIATRLARPTESDIDIFGT